MGTGDLCRAPQAAAHHGRAKQSSGTGPCGYWRRVLWVPGPRGQCSGKLRSLPRSQGSGTGPSASCVYCCPLCPVGDQYSGKICFIGKPEVHDEGVALWLNVVLTLGLSIPVKIQVRDLVRVVGIVSVFAQRGGESVFGGNSFSRSPGGKLAQETCAGCPCQWYTTGKLGKVQGRDRVGIVDDPVGRARGVSVRGKFV